MLRIMRWRLTAPALVLEWSRMDLGGLPWRSRIGAFGGFVHLDRTERATPESRRVERRNQARIKSSEKTKGLMFGGCLRCLYSGRPRLYPFLVLGDLFATSSV